MKKLLYKGRSIVISIIVVAFLSLISFVVMTLWNNLLPEILNVNAITFWQAMGIFILCKILFGFGKGGGMGAPWMKNKCSTMSQEDREKFRSEMRERMCSWKNFGKQDSTKQP